MIRAAFIAVFFITIVTGCTSPKTERGELYQALIDYESEFWFDRSISHVLLNRMVSNNTQVVWSTNFHTAAPVPLGAVGPHKYINKLKGIIHNDSIGRVLKEAVADGVNIITVIGDGMGNMHMALPVYMRYAQNNPQASMFEKIMAEGSTGYVYTSTIRGLVTGSAASGTAIACGQKTMMNMIGVDSTGTPLTSVMTLAKQNGYRTALVTNASITDATPAAFYAHTVNRNEENKIAQQLVSSHTVDVIMGGGGQHFIPQGKSLFEMLDVKEANNYTSARKDTLNLLKDLGSNAYQLIHNKKELSQLDESTLKVAGFFAAGGLPAPINYEQERTMAPTLGEMSLKSLSLVQNKTKPYIAVIECARIDWESHDNDIGAVYKSVENMNEILKTAYSFYSMNPDNTLLLFTSDHETGGLEIAYRKMPKEYQEEKILSTGKSWSNDTNPLSYERYIATLNQQKKTVSFVLRQSHTVKELKQNAKKYLGIRLSDQEADLLLYAMKDYQKYKD